MRFTTRENLQNFLDNKFSCVGMTTGIYSLEKLDEFKREFRKKDARVLRDTKTTWSLVVQGGTCWLFKANNRTQNLLYVPIVGAKFFVGSTPRCRCIHIWCPKWGRVYSFASRKKGVKIPPSKLKDFDEEVKEEVKKRTGRR